jgi:hypothetical protein
MAEWRLKDKSKADKNLCILLLQSEEFEYYQFIVPMFGLSLR